jgi:biotin carboxyl carrier protein
MQAKQASIFQTPAGDRRDRAGRGRRRGDRRPRHPPLAGRAAQGNGAAERAVPTVSLVAMKDIAGAPMELPARIEAWSRAPIYARVSGYLQRWNVDIGAPVKAGQVLATIETPDLDQDLRQAQAQLAVARSNLALAESTAKRWQSLVAQQAVSKQEADEKQGDFMSKQSTVQALQASVERQQALKRYTQLTAPFDGVVTARNTDVGALVNAGLRRRRRQRAVRGVRPAPPARVRAGAAAPGGADPSGQHGPRERAGASGQYLPGQGAVAGPGHQRRFGHHAGPAGGGESEGRAAAGRLRHRAVRPGRDGRQCGRDSAGRADHGPQRRPGGGAGCRQPGAHQEGDDRARPRQRDPAGRGRDGPTASSTVRRTGWPMGMW